MYCHKVSFFLFLALFDRSSPLALLRSAHITCGVSGWRRPPPPTHTTRNGLRSAEGAEGSPKRPEELRLRSVYLIFSRLGNALYMPIWEQLQVYLRDGLQCLSSLASLQGLSIFGSCKRKKMERYMNIPPT